MILHISSISAKVLSWSVKILQDIGWALYGATLPRCREYRTGICQQIHCHVPLTCQYINAKDMLEILQNSAAHAKSVNRRAPAIWTVWFRMQLGHNVRTERDIVCLCCASVYSHQIFCTSMSNPLPASTTAEWKRKCRVVKLMKVLTKPPSPFSPDIAAPVRLACDKSRAPAITPCVNSSTWRAGAAVTHITRRFRGIFQNAYLLIQITA